MCGALMMLGPTTCTCGLDQWRWCVCCSWWEPSSPSLLPSLGLPLCCCSSPSRSAPLPFQWSLAFHAALSPRQTGCSPLVAGFSAFRNGLSSLIYLLASPRCSHVLQHVQVYCLVDFECSFMVCINDHFALCWLTCDLSHAVDGDSILYA